MYRFDPSLSAKATLKERFVWMLYLGIIFFLLYGSANQYAHLNAPHGSLVMAWEKHIPFIADFIVPYMSSDIMFVIAFFFPYTRLELRVLAVRVLFIIVVAVMIFVLYPLECSFTKPAVESYALLFNMLKADLPYNQLPSLHIAFAVVLWASMKSHMHLFFKVMVALWLVLIGVSTLFVYQHNFVDIPTGLLLGVSALYLFKEDQDTYILNRFTTPRSLKMGLYYLLTSILFMMMAFMVSWIFLWFFITLFLVSIIYAFGLGHLLAGKDVKANPLQWLIFGPYFIGNAVSWSYYKRRLPLMRAIETNFYIGRQPSANEYILLQKKGINRIINLATEQQLLRSPIAETRLAFLDQTIQDPRSLHEAVLLIERYEHEGLFLHCALGLSRTVLVLSAWMLYKGESLEEINARLERIQPQYVKAPYMQINLVLYQQYHNSNH
jgi:protein-tyrosine phosphatase/membrane-associated phospholipid phosphatase